MCVSLAANAVYSVTMVARCWTAVSQSSLGICWTSVRCPGATSLSLLPANLISCCCNVFIQVCNLTCLGTTLGLQEGFLPIHSFNSANITAAYQERFGGGESYLPVRAGLVIRKANQLSSLLALHLACGAGYEYSKWVSQRNNFW